jgi:hypothetical protein
MTHLIAQARAKYGDAVYGKTVFDLAKEFGCEAFPYWIARFTIDLSYTTKGPQYWIPYPAIREEDKHTELWLITESFCYASCVGAYENAMTPEEKAYFKVFSEALRYDSKIGLL